MEYDGKYFSYNVIRSKDRVVEYAIYSYNNDGSFDDVENIVTLTVDESIEDYIREKYWPLLDDYKDE